jgi:NAD(P)H-dependent FMN reductase
MKKIFAIIGSTRKDSTNHALVRAIADLYADTMELVFFEGAGTLPHFNPDVEETNIDDPVLNFRRSIREADGVLICTPEYAHGVPGSLKNAIDWTVGTSDFSGKPTVLITASTDGRMGHASLLETLKVIEAENIDGLQLLISFARTKVGPSGISDPQTLQAIRGLINDLYATIEGMGR